MAGRYFMRSRIAEGAGFVVPAGDGDYLMTNDEINAIADQTTDALMVGFGGLIAQTIHDQDQRDIVMSDVRLKVWSALKVGALKALEAAGVQIEGGIGDAGFRRG